MIIRVDMITTDMVIIVLKAIYRGLGLTSGQHSSTDYPSTGEYSTSSVEYRGFEYYHYEADIAQLLPLYYSDAGSSS